MRLLRGSLVVVGLALGGVALAPPAWAAPPVELEAVSERGVVTLLEPPRLAGRTTHVVFTETTTLSGGLTSAEDQPVVSRFSCAYVGGDHLVCHGEQVFTGTVEGFGEGTITSKVRFQCSETSLTMNGTCRGSATTISSTGDLAGVRGHSTFQGDLGTGTMHVSMRLVRP